MKKIINQSNILVALDIGTTKICVLVGQRISDDEVDILGIGRVPSLGISRGVVVDIAEAVHTIKKAIQEAEIMSGYKIECVDVGISGSHIQSINSQGMIPIKRGQISTDDISKVIVAAKAVNIPEGQQVLHVLPQYFVIDGNQTVMDPVGMHGVRLEANVHIITGAVASVQNIVHCCKLAGVNVTDVVLEHLASAESVLSKDEKRLGVGILDIGGGTADFALYQNGAIRYTQVFPVAGSHVTNDIALCLRTSIKDAERIKREYGSALIERTDNISFDVELADGLKKRKVLKQDLSIIIESRISELFSLLDKEISENKLESYMPAGLVLTGGASLLKNIEINAHNILNIPVRVGHPNVPAIFRQELSSPIYATGYGLLLSRIRKNRKNSINQLTGPFVVRILGRMKSWITDFF